MAVEELGLRLRTDGVLEATNGVNLTGKAVEGLGKSAATAAPQMERLGKTSKETAAAMRLLPAQITDIFTSLASGMPAWLVFVQQGGQIKDSFGGIGPTFRALTAAINPMTVALVGGGTAVGLLTLAYSQGLAEAQGYTEALVMTGNAAGTTADQMSDMAARIDQTIGTQRAAAEALALMAGSARVGANDLERFSELAIRMERATGRAVGETVKVFGELARAPLQASIKLNEQVNFLTRDLYAQISALMEQGRETDAARLAQTAYADAIAPRITTLEGNLGTLQRAWRAVTGTAAEAWDAMLGIGRADTASEEISKLEARIKALDERRSDNPRQTAARRATLVEQLDALRETERLSRRSATAQAAEAAAVREFIKAEEEKRRNQNTGRTGRAERPEPPVFFDVLDARDGMIKLRDAQEAMDSANMAFFDKALRDQEQRDERRMQATTQYLDQLQEANERAGLELIEDAQLRGEALIELDKRIALRRLEAQGLTGAANDGAVASIEARAAIDRARLRAGERRDIEADRARDAESLRQSIETGIIEGFRDGRRVGDIFFRELQAQALRTVLRVPMQAISQGGADLIGMLLQGVGGLIGGGFSGIDPAPGDYATGDIIRGRRAGGGMVDPNSAYLVGEDGPEVLKMGSRGGQVLNAQQAAQGGGGRSAPNITYAPSIHIDSRTDRADILSTMQQGLRQSQAELLEMMDRRQV
jgi:phage-related minor tail protein